MASIQFRLRSKANKNVSIKVRVLNGKETDLELNTGFTINPKDWSGTTERPKQNNPENKVIFNNLKKLESFLFEHLNNDLGTGSIIDNYWLESQINDCFKRIEKTDTGLITNHIQYIIDNANTRKIAGRKTLGISESRTKGYVTFKNNFTEFEKTLSTKKSLNFLDLNKSTVDKYTNWLINTQKYSVNYAGKMIDNLKTVSLDAAKNDIQINPYVSNISGFSESSEDRYIITLTFDELDKIRNTNFENSSLENAKNWLLIGCTIGQRGSDLLNITADNVRYNKGNLYLDIVQQKTGKSVTIGVIAPHIIDIIENKLPYKISSQNLNTYIKKVCQISGISTMVWGKKLNTATKRKELKEYPKHELITSHSFRRSFATNYYKRVPTAILINITAHSKESLFLEYINQREDKDINADLFMKFYADIHKDKTPQMKVLRTANDSN